MKKTCLKQIIVNVPFVCYDGYALTKWIETIDKNSDSRLQSYATI